MLEAYAPQVPGLSRDDLRRIEAALATVTVQGDRYPAHLAARAGR